MTDAEIRQWLKNEAALKRIRRAGPALLAALEEMLAHLLAHASLGLNENEVAMLRRAEAAIAQARGPKKT